MKEIKKYSQLKHIKVEIVADTPNGIEFVDDTNHIFAEVTSEDMQSAATEVVDFLAKHPQASLLFLDIGFDEIIVSHNDTCETILREFSSSYYYLKKRREWENKHTDTTDIGVL